MYSIETGTVPTVVMATGEHVTVWGLGEGSIRLTYLLNASEQEARRKLTVFHGEPFLPRYAAVYEGFVRVVEDEANGLA